MAVPDLRLSAIGMATHHGAAVNIDRSPDLSAEQEPMWTFVRLIDRCEIETSHGIVQAAAGDCILHAPDSPCRYRAVDDGLATDWFVCCGDRMPWLIERLELSTGLPLRPRPDDFVYVALHDLLHEWYHRQEHWQWRAALRIEDLLLQLARNTRPQSHRDRAEEERVAAFQTLRMQVHERFHEAWDVPRMAALVHLSSPRFSVLYRRYFGRSPKDDLLRRRIDRAKYLLAYSDLTVAAVAERCGFASVEHFTRLFSKQVGSSPGRFFRGAARSDGA